MAAARLAVAVEPLENWRVVYLPMGPGVAGAKSRGRLMLTITIGNQESAPVHVANVTISFPGSKIAAVTKPVNRTIAASASTFWLFPTPSDQIVFDLPGPPRITLAFQCTTFSDKTEFTYGFAPHRNPVATGAYLFPSQSEDLALGEYWCINGCRHDLGKNGSQIFAYDMDVWGANYDDGTYAGTYPGTTGANNADFRVFGKPVRAMADGTVVQFVNDCPDNPAPLPLTGNKVMDDALAAAQRNAYWGKYAAANGGEDVIHGGSGNHFYMQHGDELVLYAHMQKGTLTSEFLKVGASVKAGDRLGLAGNSGSSSGPHLHIHAVHGTYPEDGPLRPFVLRDAWAIDNDFVIKGQADVPWALLDHLGIPESDPKTWYAGDVFLSPGPTLPQWPEVVHLAVAEDDYQQLFERMSEKGLRPDVFDAYTMDVLGRIHAYFNVVFRPAAGITVHSRFGLTADEYQQEFEKWTGQDYRLTSIESYWSHTRQAVCYAPIFVKGDGAAFTTYHGKTAEEHQKLFDSLIKERYVAKNISVAVDRNGAEHYTALYEKRNVGAWLTQAGLSFGAYQQLFDDNVKKNLKIAYVNSYGSGPDVKLLGIWYEDLPSPAAAHGMIQAEVQIMMSEQRKHRRYLRSIAGFQSANSWGKLPGFACVWNR